MASFTRPKNARGRGGGRRGWSWVWGIGGLVRMRMFSEAAPFDGRRSFVASFARLQGQTHLAYDGLEEDAMV